MYIWWGTLPRSSFDIAIHPWHATLSDDDNYDGDRVRFNEVMSTILLQPSSFGV